MAHIAVIAPPTPGHLNPLAVLGAELAGLGHQVTIVHVPGVERFVTGAQIGFAAIAQAHRAPSLEGYLATLGQATGLRGTRRMIAATAAVSAALLDGAPAVLAQTGADAVIADSAEGAGPLIAERLRLPYVVSVTGLPLLAEESVPPPFLGWRYRPDAVGRRRNRGGYAVSNLLMRPIARVLAERRRRWSLDAGEAAAHVAQCPRGLDYPREALPPHFHYGGPWRAEAPAPVDLPDEPLVFCSLGTLQGSRRALFAAMADACRAVGARAVIGHAGGLTPADVAALPGDPLVRSHWPQEAVLRRCRAAILHGGFNTVLDALAAAVPIVAVPLAFEQPGTAARIAWAGAGRVVSPRGLTAGRLATALGDVLADPDYAAAAGRLSAEMSRSGGARRAAAIVSAALSGA